MWLLVCPLRFLCAPQLMANYIARMWVTAMGEHAIGYNLHGGGENLLFLDDIGTPTLGAVAIHTMAVQLQLGTARAAGRLPFNDRLGPGPGPGNHVLLPRGPFRGYVFEHRPQQRSHANAAPTGSDTDDTPGAAAGVVVVAIWMVDAEFGTVGTVRLAAPLSEAQLQGVQVLDTFGQSVPLQVVQTHDNGATAAAASTNATPHDRGGGGDGSAALEFELGRDVVYILFRGGGGGESAATTVAQAQEAVVGMLATAVDQVGSSQGWPTPFW